ncbi:MAG: precorrin-6A reductase [Ruminiclostridium sp.]|nr:precorrin-6A reductase [Ruminiclostridium sp.]
MKSIVLFAGTGEGRELASYCAENGIYTVVSCATEYGTGLLPQSEYLRPVCGRLDERGMRQLIDSERPIAVFDATHPYAQEASRNICAACSVRVQYIRVLRDPEPQSDYALYFDSMEEIASYLSENDGNVLITSGSKLIRTYTQIRDFSARCTIRVLDSEGVAEECAAAGFANIITGKGPFGYEQDREHIAQSGARFVVTKDSGAAGGFPEKLRAAQDCGVKLLVLKRPQESGISVERAKELIMEMRKMHCL